MPAETYFLKLHLNILLQKFSSLYLEIEIDTTITRAVRILWRHVCSTHSRSTESATRLVTIYTSLHATQCSDEKAVCSSVRPSVCLSICQLLVQTDPVGAKMPIFNRLNSLVALSRNT